MPNAARVSPPTYLLQPHPQLTSGVCLSAPCCQVGAHFTDPEFPPEASSVYLDPFNPPDEAVPPDCIQWLRVSEICPGDPQMFCDGVEAGDVVQGALSDCWILSAVSIVATQPGMLESLLVSDVYAADHIYVWKFFKEGQWLTVIIDDWIPCELSGEPLYARSKDPNEIWVMLLEKAYAKLHGCYEALNGGLTD